MTDLQNLLDQIQRLDQQATKGPWHSHFGSNPGDKWLSVEPEIGSRTICTVTDDHKPNAALIAQARTLLPQLAKALQAVMELHKPSELYPAVLPGVIYCVSCWDGLTDESYEYPCPTAQAITDAIGADDAG